MRTLRLERPLLESLTDCNGSVAAVASIRGERPCRPNSCRLFAKGQRAPFASVLRPPPVQLLFVTRTCNMNAVGPTYIGRSF